MPTPLLPTPPRRGRRCRAAELVFGGTGLTARPQERPPAGATDAGGSPFLSGVADRERDELGAVVRFHPEQHRMLALRTCVGEALADVGRVHRLAPTSRITSPTGNRDRRTPPWATAVTTTPLTSAPETLFAGASVNPSRGMSLSGTSALILILVVRRLLLIGNVPSVRVTVLS